MTGHTRLSGHRLAVAATGLGIAVLAVTSCSGGSGDGTQPANTPTPVAIPSTTAAAKAFTAKVNAVCSTRGRAVAPPSEGTSQVAYFQAYADNLQKEYTELVALTPPAGYEGYTQVLAEIKPVPGLLRQIAAAYGENDLTTVQKISTQLSDLALGNVWLKSHGMSACAAD